MNTVLKGNGVTLSGPMFEPADDGIFKSLYGRSGAHYNQYGFTDENGMTALRQVFGEHGNNITEMNFVLFSTSGVHGTYTTIEEAEEEFYLKGTGHKFNKDGDSLEHIQVTALIIQPRVCCMSSGNCEPKSKEDFAYLKVLRAKSWDAMLKIGHDEKTNYCPRGYMPRI